MPEVVCFLAGIVSGQSQLLADTVAADRREETG